MKLVSPKTIYLENLYNCERERTEVVSLTRKTIFVPKQYRDVDKWPESAKECPGY
jgi:hypothetical protein